MKTRHSSNRVKNLVNFKWSSILTLSVLSIFCLSWLASAIKSEETAQADSTEFIYLGDKLAEASDRLTDDVRHFSITGESNYLKKYWMEASFYQTREHVLKKVETLNVTPTEENLLKLAKENSDKLMVIEIHSMKLILTALGIPEERMYPAIQSYPLPSTDIALSPAQKISEAQHLVFNDQYARAKKSIMQPIRKFEYSAVARTHKNVVNAEKKLKRYINSALTLSICIAILAFGLGVSNIWFNKKIKI